MMTLFFLFVFIFVPSHHLVARVYESKAEFRSALQHEKEGYTIYKNQVAALNFSSISYDEASLFSNFLFSSPVRWARPMRKPRRAQSI